MLSQPFIRNLYKESFKRFSQICPTKCTSAICLKFNETKLYKNGQADKNETHRRLKKQVGIAMIERGTHLIKIYQQFALSQKVQKRWK
jgi:hypothetical protein